MTNEKPLPQDFAESVVAYEKLRAEAPTKERIYSMLNDAMDNDYDMTGWSIDDIVADLLAYADLRDDETEDVIRPHVITWKMCRTPPT